MILLITTGVRYAWGIGNGAWQSWVNASTSFQIFNDWNNYTLEKAANAFLDLYFQ